MEFWRCRYVQIGFVELGVIFFFNIFGFNFIYLFYILSTRARTHVQGGQEWARRLELKELARIAAEEAKAKEADKKKQ